MNNDAGYAIGSIEGRVHLQYYGELAAHSFPFRCHRTVDNTKAPPCTYINPVTSLSFHPITGALATTGGDDIALWNHYGKVSIKTITPKEGPISTGKFSPDGSMYAYACSYDWSLGANGPGRQKRHRIFIRAVKEEDVAITAPAAK
jgi:mRNA export factor